MNIWNTSTSMIKWRNLSKVEKYIYKIISPPNALSKSYHTFFGRDDILVLASFNSFNVSRHFISQTIQKQHTLYKWPTEESKNVLKKSNNKQVLILFIHSNDSEMVNIISKFKGNKIICCMGCSETNLEHILLDFEMVPTSCSGCDMFFIRTFKDKINQSNANQWYLNELTEEEREEYSIITPYEQKIHETGLCIKSDNSQIDELFNIIDCMKKSLDSVQKSYTLAGIVFSEYKYDQPIKPFFGYHLPCKIEIDSIIKFVGRDTILSVYSGIAFIEYILTLHQVKITATDNFSEILGEPWINVMRRDAIMAVMEYGDNVLFMCWPNFESDHAFYTLTEFKGSKLIYIGKRNSECCIENKFWDLIENEFQNVKSGYENDSLHSEVCFYIRKSCEQNQIHPNLTALYSKTKTYDNSLNSLSHQRYSDILFKVIFMGQLNQNKNK